MKIIYFQFRSHDKLIRRLEVICLTDREFVCHNNVLQGVKTLVVTNTGYIYSARQYLLCIIFF